MITLPRPNFHVEDIVNICVTTIDSAEFRLRLLAEVQALVDFESVYEGKGQLAQLFEFPEAQAIGAVSVGEMKWVYTNKLASVKGIGRSYYDALMLSAPFKICPLCNQRKVSTLDHYLSKSNHPAFAVTPLNLVPSCKDCNLDTRVRRAARSEDQTLHPYFDSVDDEIWLVASVIEGSPPVVIFDVRAPAAWAALKYRMVESHFREFRLAALYSTHAGAEMVEIYYDLSASGRTPSANEVREYLAEKGENRRNRVMNSWQAAMYAGLADSDWYCNGGYVEVV